MVIETARQAGFDDAEKWRDIEIARREQPVLANVLDLALNKRGNAIGLAVAGHALRQNRISYRLECLRDQGRADRARRIAAPDRQHAAAKPDRYGRIGKQIACKIDDLPRIVLLSQPC